MSKQVNTSGNGNVVRATVMGPFPAMAKVNADAKKLSFFQDGKEVPYLLCNKTVPGGVVEMSVFGDAEPGKNIPVAVEVKTRTKMGVTTHYIRAEVLTSGERPKHRLYVGTLLDPNLELDKEAPIMIFIERMREIAIGFIRR